MRHEIAIKPMVVEAQQKALVAGIMGAAQQAGMDRYGDVRLFVEAVERLVAAYDVGRSERIRVLTDRLFDLAVTGASPRPIVLERSGR